MKKEEHEGSPAEVLERRLATGEIDRAEYEEIRRALGGPPTRRRFLATPWLVVAIVVATVVALTAATLAVSYGPWRAADGTGWGGCCPWGPWGNRDGPGPAGYDVAIVNYAFGPQEIRVSLGTTVTWMNMDHVMHTVTFGEHGQHAMGMDSGPMDHMDRWSYTFQEPGVYEYHCDPHPYMTGTVVVEG